MKRAVIFGVTGQDGSYLAELLLGKGYEVVGVKRRTSQAGLANVHSLHVMNPFRLVDGDVTDPVCVLRLLEEIRPDEVYNLAAQSHVGVSFGEPHHTTQVTYLGCLNCLEAIRHLQGRGLRPRFYQASSSEMFGSSCSWWRPDSWGDADLEHATAGDECPRKMFQNEHTPMLPNSPYAVAKLAAHHLVRVYRNAYGVFACSGILFNHESERRSPEFVTRKISRHVAECWAAALRKESPPRPLKLGNLEARRDWGHAEDYVRGMWLMLQQVSPQDFVLATGETHSVREFLHAAFAVAGIEAEGHVEADPSLLRPCEVHYLRGDASRARRVLGWRPEVTFDGLVRRMVLHDRDSQP